MTAKPQPAVVRLRLMEEPASDTPDDLSESPELLVVRLGRMENRLSVLPRHLQFRYLADQVRPAGDGRRLETAMHSELGEDILDIGPQGTYRDVHLAGHLP